MPDFEITLPNGTRIGGSAPEGTTQEQIIAEYEKQHGQQKQNFLSIFGGGLLKGLLSGGSASEPQMPYEPTEQFEARLAAPQVLEEKFPTPTTISGRIVQGAGEGLGNPMNLIGAPGLARTAARTAASVTAGIGSELGGLATNDSLLGRVIGGVVGGTVPRGAVRAGGRIAGTIAPRPELPSSVPPERVAPVATLRAAGIEPTAGDVLGHRFVKSLERNADRLFGKSYERMKTEVLETYTRAISREIGEDASRLTPDVFRNVETRAEQLFQQAARRLPFPQDRTLGNRLQAITAEMFKFRYAEAEINRISGLIDDINEGFTSGKKTGYMDGKTYQAKTRYDSQLGKATRDPNANIAEYARQVRQALDDSLLRYVAKTARSAFTRGRAGGPAQARAMDIVQTFEGLLQARRQWRNMLVLQKSITGPGEVPAQGLVLPERLRAALTSEQGGKAAYAAGQGRLVELANAGTAVIEPYRPPGWAEWAAAHAPWWVGTAILSGGTLGLKSAAMAVTPDIMGRVVNTRTAQNMLKNQRATSLLNQLEGARNIAARSAAQAVTTQPQGLVQPSSLIGQNTKDGLPPWISPVNAAERKRGPFDIPAEGSGGRGVGGGASGKPVVAPDYSKNSISKAEMFDLFEQGKSITEIADIAGVSRPYVSRLLKDANLTKNPTGFTADTWRNYMVEVKGYPLATKGSIWANVDNNTKLVRLFNEGLSPREIAQELGTTAGQVSGRMRRINLENKSVSELQTRYGERWLAKGGTSDSNYGLALDARIKSMLGKGMTQAAIARELKVSPASISMRLQRLRDKADPESAFERDLARRKP